MRTNAIGIPVALVAIATGCSKQPDNVVTPDGSNTQRRLTAAYSLYTTFLNKKERTPANAEELSAFGLNLPSTEGGPVNLTPEFLLSPRDRQPIVVRYGLPLKPGSKPAPGQETGSPPAEGPVLAHEAAGVGGKRFVVFAGTGRIEEVDEARFRELVP